MNLTSAGPDILSPIVQQFRGLPNTLHFPVLCQWLPFPFSYAVFHLTTLSPYVYAICKLSVKLTPMKPLQYNELKEKDGFPFQKVCFIRFIMWHNKCVTIKFTTIYYTVLKRQNIACFKIYVSYKVSRPLNTMLQCQAHEQRSQFRRQQHVRPLLFFSARPHTHTHTHTQTYFPTSQSVSSFMSA